MPFTLCPACRLPSVRIASGLPCPECRDALLIAPPICPRCLGLACAIDACLRPWIRVDGEAGAARFDSVTAAYLSVGPGAAVLKAWKRSPHPILARHLFPEIRAKISAFSFAPSLVLVPVPQSGDRRWELGGGSVWRLCELILEARAGRADIVLDTLALNPARTLEPERPQQAKSKGDERYTRRSAIGPGECDLKPSPSVLLDGNAGGPTVLVVDDFLTSGATLRSAVAATRKKFEESGWFGGRATRIGVFVLGFRPTLFDG